MKICPTCSEIYADEGAFCPSDGSSLQTSTDPFLGKTLAARYRLIRRIGTGGMALVYAAKHLVIERINAIKILRQDLGTNPIHRERFLREARAVNRIQHPNIIEITDFGEADSFLYLVMEYIDGEPLSNVIKRGPLGWKDTVFFAAQVASALGRSHEMGILHRDVKPENMLVQKGGASIKMTDFGLAKVLDAPSLTRADQIVGTPGYIAPECASGKTVDARCDLYALGIMMYEMLSGELPYAAKTQAELLMAPFQMKPTRLNTRVRDLPPALEQLVHRLIEREPSDRPRSAFEVRDILVSLASQEALSLSRPSPRGPSVQFDEGITEGVSSVRWHATLAELESAIDTARRRGATNSVEKGSELALKARELVNRFERIAAGVCEHQRVLDDLERQARTVRSTMEHAIDELARERADKQAKIDASRAKRREHALAAAEGEDRRPSTEFRIWQDAVMATDEEREEILIEDLSFQLECLKDRLHQRDEKFEEERVITTSRLEGALTALRTLTTDLTDTLSSAAVAVAGARVRKSSS